VNVLDSQRSMNVSIFLRQYAAAGDAGCDIVQWLRDGDAVRLGGAERLRAMLHILPEPRDVELLAPYITSTTSRLAAAERFYVELMALRKYVLDSRCMHPLHSTRSVRTICHLRTPHLNFCMKLYEKISS